MRPCTCAAVAAALAIGAVAPAGCSGSGAPEPAIPTVVQVAAGFSHTCALLADGSVRCWGRNLHGQLGDGTYADRWTPAPVTSLAGAIAIAAGEDHSCALLGDGTARCWGGNFHHELGDDADEESRPFPDAVHGVEHAATVAAPGASILSARWRHTCAVLADGTARCWGHNYAGQLGDGSSLGRRLAVTVTGLTGVRSIATGGSHTCALLTDRTVKCWGLYSDGRLGNTGSFEYCLPVVAWWPCVTTPTQVPELSLVDALTAGDAFTCALVGGAVVSGWGSNADGQLLAAVDAGAYAATPRVLPDVWSVGMIAAGAAHACAIWLDGSVGCWGRNEYGQLGHGTPDDHARGAVEGLRTASAIAAGPDHTCALAPGRGLLCWGRNALGQLGDGTTTDRRAPVPVRGLGR